MTRHTYRLVGSWTNDWGKWYQFSNGTSLGDYIISYGEFWYGYGL